MGIPYSAISARRDPLSNTRLRPKPARREVFLSMLILTADRFLCRASEAPRGILVAYVDAPIDPRPFGRVDLWLFFDRGGSGRSHDLAGVWWLMPPPKENNNPLPRTAGDAPLLICSTALSLAYLHDVFGHQLPTAWGHSWDLVAPGSYSTIAR